MQFGQVPWQQRSPRGRWYLKLREKMRCPSPKSAEAIVSPSNPRAVAPWKVNSSSRAAVEALAWLRREPHFSAGTSTERTSFVRVSRSAVNQAWQPWRWRHHSRWTPARCA